MKRKRRESRSDQELRTIALAVYAGRIITNAQADENQWRQYVLTQPPIIVEFKQLNVTERAKLRKFMKDIRAWERGAKMVRTGEKLASLKSGQRSCRGNS